MNSIFTYARTTDEEDPEIKTSDIFSESKKLTPNIIPPIGIAKPELVETFMSNIDNEEEIRKHIAENEAYERETPFESAKRQTLAHGARGIESYVGGTGDIQLFFENITGAQYPEREYPTKKEKKARSIFPDIESLEGPNPFAYKSPTTSDVREITKKQTGRFLEPKNEYDKITQEIVSDVGSLANPIGGRLAWSQRILLPLVGQATKQTLKSVGASEKEQEIGKLVTMGIASIANLGNARNVAIDTMNRARNMMPRGLRFNAQGTTTALNNIRNQPWYRTGTDPTKAPAFEMIERVENAIDNRGFINGQDAMQLRTDINDARRRLGGFKVPGNPDKRAALNYLNQVDQALLHSMEHYGTRVNPRWWQTYNLGNEAFRVTQRSEAISNFLHSSYGKPFTSEIAKVAFGTALAQGGLRVPIIGMGAGALLAARKGFQVINRMIQSPVLRQHYLDVISAASRQNSTMTAKALEKFDREAKKLESSNRQKNDQSEQKFPIKPDTKNMQVPIQ